MNNEPVAYRYFDKDIGWLYHDWRKGFDAKGVIPLYTHPAKTEDEPNWKEMYWEMHELNHKHWSELKAHPSKDLTDEEIDDLADEILGIQSTEDVAYIREFARAILRKANEK